MPVKHLACLAHCYGQINGRPLAVFCADFTTNVTAKFWLASPELNPPVNSDSNPDHMPKEDPEETSAQVGGVLPFPLRLTSTSSFGPLPTSTKWEVVSLCAQLLAALFLCRNPCSYSPLRTQGFNFSYFFFPIWLCCTACRILVPQPGIEPGTLAMKAQSPNHWTTGNSSTSLNLFTRIHEFFCTRLMLPKQNPGGLALRSEGGDFKHKKGRCFGVCPANLPQ